MGHVAVIADDLSGAAELAAAAWRRGWSVELSQRPDASAMADVCVFDTGARALRRDVAVARVEEFARAVREGFERRFLKIDSVLRGHWGAEAEALRRELGYARVVVAAGNPSRARVVRDGKLYVEGELLEASVFAADPAFPAHTSEVAVRWAASGGRADAAAELLLETSAERLAAAASSLGPDQLAVGSLDFFEACLGAWGLQRTEREPATVETSGRLLLVCGSRASWGQREELFRSHGWLVRVLGAGGQLPEGRAAARELAGLGTGDWPRPAEALDALARAVAAEVAARPPDLLCVEGGETAEAVLRALDWKRFRVEGELSPGTAMLGPHEGDVPVVVKPGSYAWPRGILAPAP